ncbi:thioesterase II family protein [Pseudomonadota bacterium]
MTPLSHPTQLKLISLPFAGGSTSCYAKLETALPSSIQLWTHTLPGRGSRISEKLLDTLDTLVCDAMPYIEAEIGTTPYALFGHSMGAITAYLVLRQIQSTTLPAPLALVVSGRSWPGLPPKKQLHLLSKEALCQELRQFGGIPSQVMEDNDLFTYFEPVIRTDLTALNQYEHTIKIPTSVPILCLVGEKDKLNLDGTEHWQRLTTAKFQRCLFPGNHFFIFDKPKEIAHTIEHFLFATQYPHIK